jgi:hypothetical protein
MKDYKLLYLCKVPFKTADNKLVKKDLFVLWNDETWRHVWLFHMIDSSLLQSTKLALTFEIVVKIIQICSCAFFTFMLVFVNNFLINKAITLYKWKGYLDYQSFVVHLSGSSWPWYCRDSWQETGCSLRLVGASVYHGRWTGDPEIKPKQN